MEDYAENIALVENFSENSSNEQPQEGDSIDQAAELTIEQTSIRR